MEIYNDNLSAMAQELTTDGEVKPTKVQLLSNLAYDKLTRYLNELERKKMIIQSPLSITEKGRDFLQDYDRIASFINEMGLKYLNISEEKDIARSLACSLEKSTGFLPIRVWKFKIKISLSLGYSIS